MKKATINDVAKASGFGIGTVSRVLSDDPSVKESTRKKILATIEELHYVRNVNGVRLRRKHTGVIALMVPVINHPFFAEFAEELEQVADKDGTSLLLITSQMNEQKEKEILDKIKQKEIDGGIFVTHYEHGQEDLAGCPLVSIDRHLNGQIPYVSSDNYESTRKALESFYSHGARRIGFIGTKPSVESEVLLRKKAYDDFIEEKGLQERAKWEVTAHGEEPALVDAFLKENQDVDAVFASNSALGIEIFRKIRSSGKKIPEEVELIAYDEVPTSWAIDSIDCIRQDIKGMAIAAYSLLKDLIDEKQVPRVTILPASYLKGQTTKNDK